MKRASNFLFYREFENQSRAYTMVEILVVVALIVILAALLFPFAKRAIAGAHEAACNANLRSLALAAQQYIGDHDGVLFSRSYTTDLAPYISGLDTWWSSKSKKKSLVSCPTVNAMRGTKYNSGIYGINYVFINTIDGATPGQPPATWPLRITNIEKLQRAWIFTEASRIQAGGGLNIDPLGYVAYGNIYAQPPSGSSWLLWPHPNNKRNFVFFDGHVESLSLDEVKARTGTSSNSPAFKEFHGLK